MNKTKNISKVLLFLMMCASVFYSFKTPSISAVIKEASSLSNTELKAILADADPNIIIKFSFGDDFPLKLSYTSDFFSINAPENLPYSVSVTRDFYIYKPEKELVLFSLDGQTWKTFTEIFTGNVNLGLIEANNGEHYVEISGHLKERVQKTNR